MGTVSGCNRLVALLLHSQFQPIVVGLQLCAPRRLVSAWRQLGGRDLDAQVGGHVGIVGRAARRRAKRRRLVADRHSSRLALREVAGGGGEGQPVPSSSRSEGGFTHLFCEVVGVPVCVRSAWGNLTGEADSRSAPWEGRGEGLGCRCCECGGGLGGVGGHGEEGCGRDRGVPGCVCVREGS